MGESLMETEDLHIKLQPTAVMDRCVLLNLFIHCLYAETGIVRDIDVRIYTSLGSQLIQLFYM